MQMIRAIFSHELVLLPFYAYKLIALLAFKNMNSAVAIFACTGLATMVTCLLFPIIILFAIFYSLVEFYLEITLGHEFYKILDGCDRIWAIKSSSKSVLNALYVITPNGNTNLPSELRQLLIEKYSIIAKTHPRFSSVIKSCLGLQYYHRIILDFNSCVKYMHDYSNAEEFHALLDDYSNKDMPEGDTYLWEVYIGTKIIPWYDGAEMYPILMRYHHSIGDGVSLITLTTTHLSSDGINIMRNKCETYKTILQKNKNSKDKNASIAFLKNGLYCPVLSEPEKANLLHKNVLSKRKYLVFCWEKPEDEYVKKVKRIKNYYEVAFADVLFAAISASLSEHYSKHSKTPTENVLAMCPYFLMSCDFNKLVRINKENIPITKLGNKFAMGFSKVPIDLDVSNGTNNTLKVEENELIRRLRVVQRSNHQLKNALDFSACYWTLRMAGGLPLPVVKVLFSVFGATISISNVPGNTTSFLTNGCEIRDTFIVGNNYRNFGVTFTLFTYDERFRIGLLIDQSLIPERSDAQLLGDGIFKYVDALVATLPS